jgi:drug/metabolite transporter (DMT)-like permease
VATLWGATNPFLKVGAESTRLPPRTGVWARDALGAFVATLTNWRFSVPFAINQCGSFVYFYLLGSSDITMAVPITESLTILMTALTARFVLGERAPLRPAALLGAVLVLAGVTTCVHSKLGAGSA